MRRTTIIVLATLGLLVTRVPDARSLNVFEAVTAPLRIVTGGIGRHHIARGRHHRTAVAPHRKPGKAAPAAATLATPAGSALARPPESTPAAPAGSTSGSSTGSTPTAAPGSSQTAGVAPQGGVAAAPDAAAPPAGTDRRQDTRPRAEPSGWVGPLYWPHAADDLFDYDFGRPNADERFWAHGGPDLVDAIFMRSSTNPDWAAMCGSQHNDGANSWREPIEKAVRPSEAQRRALDELASALVEASKAIEAACPAADAPATPTRRLDAMTDRLWAMRQAVVLMRAPLENLSNTLSDEQKARFKDAMAGSEPGETTAAVQPSGAPPSGAAAGARPVCADPASAMVQWPSDEIERRVRPANEQRVSLRTLQMTTQGMAQLLMASCPAELPSTPLGRLDAAEKRLNAMLYAARVIGAPLQGFYLALTEQQKASFNTLGGTLRASSRGTRVPSVARSDR